MSFTSNGDWLGSTVEAKIIGRVKNDVQEGKVNDWDDVVSDIILEDDYDRLLDGIEGFSHVVVVFWMDRVEGYEPKVHPKRREDIPEQGVFATRTPYRPNPIGISSVRLLERKGTSLRVSGLDCFNGTPVLDVKPFTPKNLEITDVRIPKWMEDLFKKDEGP
jgi:tRNA-Thr(GGU) m(6)t(6)A37 methyltransferase TsaA